MPNQWMPLDVGRDETADENCDNKRRMFVRWRRNSAGRLWSRNDEAAQQRLQPTSAFNVAIKSTPESTRWRLKRMALGRPRYRDIRIEKSHKGSLYRVAWWVTVAKQVRDLVAGFLGRLKRTQHSGNTHVVDLGDDGFDFLGYHFHKRPPRRTRRLVPHAWPNQKAMQR